MSEHSTTPIGRTMVVGTAPPTRCGIATYTSHLTTALRGHGVDADILRVVDGRHHEVLGDAAVTAVWCIDDPRGARSAARACDDHDVVLLQHEFGIFPGADGVSVLEFLDEIERPLVTVLHTVLGRPTDRQRRIVDELLDRSDATVVHGTSARSRLLELHGIDDDSIVVIPHGADAADRSTDRGPTSPPFALTYGLLGPGKGIEHAIEAIALLRSAGIELPYVIAGATHPSVLAHQGEAYRDRLQQSARALGVDDLVRFDDAYRDARSQRALTSAASVVVLPYDSREQVTSGVLVEALAAGRPVVASAFPHAVEMAATGAVTVVPHGSSSDLADALVDAAIDPVTSSWMRRCARACSAAHDWSTVAGSFADVLHHAVHRLEVTR